jgi:KaiC/GvpD/RAD55 family RecA-like ATPase
MGMGLITDDKPGEVREPCYYIPFTRNMRFTGRATIMNALGDKFFGQERSQKTALVGLGGIGKTQIALHFAYQIKKKRPDYSIFWVPILSTESAERAFVEFAKKLGLHKSSEDEDVKDLVCQHLSSE